MTLGNERSGVKYFADLPTMLKTHSASAKRFSRLITAGAGYQGASVIVSIHSRHDKTLDKIAALKSRKPGDPHPFVLGNAEVKRYLTVISECVDAQVAWRASE